MVVDCMVNIEEFMERWNLTEKDIEEVKEKKLVHRQSWGGTHYILYYDKERNNIDIYRLVDWAHLGDEDK